MESATSASRRRERVALLTDRAHVGAALARASQWIKRRNASAFSARPTLICVTMTAVITAHNGKGRCKNSASASAASAAIVTLIESANCSRR
jgi:hypothetical protein